MTTNSKLQDIYSEQVEIVENAAELVYNHNEEIYDLEESTVFNTRPGSEARKDLNIGDSNYGKPEHGEIPINLYERIVRNEEDSEPVKSLLEQQVDDGEPLFIAETYAEGQIGKHLDTNLCARIQLYARKNGEDIELYMQVGTPKMDLGDRENYEAMETLEDSLEQELESSDQDVQLRRNTGDYTVEQAPTANSGIETLTTTAAGDD